MKREVSFYAVYYNDKHVDDKADRLEALQFRKLGYVEFPVLYMFVVSSYMPTPESDTLSLIFTKTLRRKLGQL